MLQSFFSSLSLALLTDLYQLKMVYGYWKAGLADRQAVFHLHFRKHPFEGGFALAAGLETAIQFLQHFQFSATDLRYLESLTDSSGFRLFDNAFLEFLSAFSFVCDVDALPEGTLVFPQEPVLRVRGPLWQAQLLESPMLNIINFQTLIATKSARICMAAYPDPVIEFGMRRAQGIDGAISASRAAYIGGCFATSDVIAGKWFEIPVRGTHAHSWVMAFEEEKEAFCAFAKILPKDCVLLVDTYDSIEGTKKAIKVGKTLRKEGFDLAGVRLDSGDLACLSIEIRKLLDESGFSDTEIMASNELDEYLIRDLKQQGAKISVWGVGTNLVTAKGQSALDGVYKLSAIQNAKGEWEGRLKLSEHTAKTTNPGILQIRRFSDERHYVADVLYDELTQATEPMAAINVHDPNDKRSIPSYLLYEDLLVPIFHKGKFVYQLPKLLEVQSHAKRELSRLAPSMSRFVNPQLYFTGLEQNLYRKKIELMKKLRQPS